MLTDWGKYSLFLVGKWEPKNNINIALKKKFKNNPKQITALKMPSSGMLRCMTLVRTDIVGKCIISMIILKNIGDLGSMLTVTSNRNAAVDSYY
jgi:hypothetical protein